MTLLLLSLSCLSPPSPDGALVQSMDTDGDGLNLSEENRSLTDPNNPDTDADSYTDGEEVEAGTQPRNPYSRPYAGGYPDNACLDSTPSPTGTQIGDIAPDFALIDQFGELVSLYSFCKRPIVLYSCAAGSPVCVRLVQEGVEDAVDEQVLVVIPYVDSGTAFTEPTLDDVIAFAQELDTEGVPVLLDPYQFIPQTYERDLDAITVVRFGSGLTLESIDQD